MPEIYQCQLCGYQADHRHISCILTHLQDRHSINKGSRANGPTSQFGQYVAKMFGNPRCMCGCGREVQLHKRKMQFNLFASSCPNKGAFNNPSCLEFHIFRGLSAEAAVDAVSEIQSKGITEMHKAKLQICNAGASNPASLASAIKRVGNVPGARRLLKRRRAKSRGFAGKHHTCQTLRKLAKVRSEQAKIVTRPELIMYGVLAGLGVSFEYQVPIDKYIVDFMVGDTVIEVFGDYWHSKKFKNGSKKASDRIKIAYLKSSGFRVIVVYESQLINRKIPQSVLDLKCESKP